MSSVFAQKLAETMNRGASRSNYDGDAVESALATVIDTNAITQAELTAALANFTADVTLAAGVDFILDGAGAGTKIGTAVSQKLGFWGATPVIQQASASQAILALDVDVTGADTVDLAAVNANFAALQVLVNRLRLDLITTGIIKGSA